MTLRFENCEKLALNLKLVLLKTLYDWRPRAATMCFSFSNLFEFLIFLMFSRIFVLFVVLVYLKYTFQVPLLFLKEITYLSIERERGSLVTYLIVAVSMR
jgi:hypothetical protein